MSTPSALHGNRAVSESCSLPVCEQSPPLVSYVLLSNYTGCHSASCVPWSLTILSL